jgi:hypothetical protein
VRRIAAGSNRRHGLPDQGCRRAHRIPRRHLWRGPERPDGFPDSTRVIQHVMRGCATYPVNGSDYVNAGR